MLNLLSKIDKMSEITGGLYTFILGILVIFLGITIIVVFVTLAGKFFSSGKKSTSTETKKEISPVKIEQPKKVEVENSDSIPEHIKVAIVAAISAYYQETKSNCDFIVKKIKRF